MGSYKLKAFIRYTKAGKVIPGSLILRKKQPHGTGWKQVDEDECCTTTTSTSSTSTTSTTTTA